MFHYSLSRSNRLNRSISISKIGRFFLFSRNSTKMLIFFSSEKIARGQHFILLETVKDRFSAALTMQIQRKFSLTRNHFYDGYR